MKCPSCDHAEMVKRTQDEKLSFGGQSLTLHDMKGEFCPKCDEGVWDAESYRRYAEAQAALLRAVKGDLSADIRRIRELRTPFRFTLGGGGFFLFYVEKHQTQFREKMKDLGLREMRYRFDFEGTKVLVNFMSSVKG